MKMKTIKILLCSALFSLGHSAEIEETVAATPEQMQDLFEIFHDCTGGGRDFADIKTELEEQNISVDTKDKNNYTMLHRACKAAKPLMAQFLLSIVANVNALASSNYTPLHILSMYELNERNFEECSARTTETAGILLAATADINAIAIGGDTPLCYAAMRKNAPLVKLLLGLGANPTLGSTCTPKEFASSPIGATSPFMKGKQEEVIAILTEAENAFATEAAQALETLAISTDAPLEETNGEDTTA